MKVNPSLWTYDTLEGCCDRFYGWDTASCMGEENSFIGLYYPNWDDIENVGCLSDGKAPSYMKNNAAVWLYDSIESCKFHGLPLSFYAL